MYRFFLINVHTVVVKLVHMKIISHYSRYSAVAFDACTSVNCLTGHCPGHDVKLHSRQVKLCRIWCAGSGFVLVKALI